MCGLLPNSYSLFNPTLPTTGTAFVIMQQKMRAVWTACLLTCSAGFTTGAIAQEQQDVGAADELDSVTAAGLDPEHKSGSDSDRVIVPVPFVTPQMGAGLAVAGAWFYQPDSKSRPWASGVGALYTSNGSRGLAGLHKMSLDQDRIRLDILAGYGEIHNRYYAIETNDEWVETKEETFIASATGRVRIGEEIFLGGRARFLSKDSRPRDQSDPPPAFDQSEFESDVGFLQLSPIFTYDTTADAFAPRKGSILNAQWTFAMPVRGEDAYYNKKQVYARHYIPGKGRSSAAFQIKGCSATQQAPFFDLCSVGLRGYSSGRFRDRSSWSAEGEWRQPVSRRFGVVGFAGLGATGSGFGDALGGKILPAVGAGVRYLAAEDYGINLRVDGAVGRDSGAVYVSIGEAF